MSDTETQPGLTAVMSSLKTTRAKGRWRKATMSNLTEAEQLLDRLEGAGYAERRVSIDGEEFVVRWR